MKRRHYLAGLGVGGLAGLAGCTSFGNFAGGTGGSDDGGSAGSPDGSGGSTDTPGAVATDVSDSDPNTVNGVEVPVPDSDLRRGASKDAIPALVEPEFGEDWSGLEMTVNTGFGQRQTIRPGLSDGSQVIAVERDGEARAYPLLILNWHEIVNDDFGGPLLVTYCPLCGSGVTAVREVDGEEAVFGVSGLLFRNALVMYDSVTESLWSQIAAASIQGEKVGASLELVPSTFTTWGEFKEQYPDGTVLRPPPDSNTVRGREAVRNYTADPYAGYKSGSAIGLGGEFDDDRLHPKTMVVGVEHDGVSRAYPLDAVQRAGVVNDEVGGLPVVVAGTESGTLVAYVREVDGSTLTFERESEAFLSADGSRWRLLSGRAVDGPHEGTRLQQANTVAQEFFFSWLNFHPETEVWGSE